MSDQLMVKLTEAVTYKFGDDKTAPSIITSKLKKGGSYCSVVRYGGPFARDKKVICKATAADLTSALKELATKFVALAVEPKNPVQELTELVK